MYLIALIFAVQTGDVDKLARKSSSAEVINTTIARSEWGSYEKLSLNVRTGEYKIIAYPNNYAPYNQHPPQIENGRLAKNNLRKIYPAYRAALRDGLTNADCDRNPRRYGLFISNARMPSLRISVGSKVYSSSRSYQCWTSAARVLNRQIDQSFVQKSIRLQNTM
jgi:hypothetical protein